MNTSVEKGRVFWITGLSGAGKSTFASELARRLRETDNFIVVLDGDELREVFGSSAASAENHGRLRRIALARQYAHLCRIISNQGATVVIATISLFREIHSWNRENLPGYFEIYLSVPLSELRRRDPKNIYQRFETGQITEVAGLDLAIDEPESPNWKIEYSPGISVEALVDDLLNSLNGATINIQTAKALK